MNRALFILLMVFILSDCENENHKIKRIPMAEVGKSVLYYDEIPVLIQHGINDEDSAALIQSYINKWARRELLLQKAEENLSPEMKADLSRQMEETRANLVIYQYQRQLMQEKMDTVISEPELENYYALNERSFILSSNIVKALFIKLPVETPDLDKIKLLARSIDQKDLQQLESYCYQFAEKFDDFMEDWVPFDRLSVELQEDIKDEENFLKETPSMKQPIQYQSI